MLSPRWKKLWRDLQTTRGRMLLLVVALAVSIVGVGAMLSAYTILNREISRNYLGTNPASAFLEVDRVDDVLVQEVRQQPGIMAAEATTWVLGRAEVSPHEWRPLLLFVISDFTAMQLDRVQPETGAWPPPDQTLLLERAALPLAQVGVGETLTVQTPNGSPQALRISGLAHDPGLAPAWQEQTLYGYITPATLEWLGEGRTLHILKISVADQPTQVAMIEATTSRLAAWLQEHGYTVGEIRVPPPGLHPHQSQMNSILITLLVFSAMALLLTAILTATMVGGWLAQQVRQIGIMKALGARSTQITGLYLTLIAVLGLAATGLGIPAGNAAGRWFSQVVGELLNFTITSTALPVWVYLGELMLGTLVPLLVALGPIWRTSRITVRETLMDYGTRRETGSGGLDAWLSRMPGVDNTLRLALRNPFRRPDRLILILGLLAAAGGMFLTGLNVKTGWQMYLTEAAASRHYDLEIRFNRPQSTELIMALVSAVPGVQSVEAWNLAPAALYRPDGLDIVRTYPDGGHGSFTLRSVPAGSQLVEMPLLSGHLLPADDPEAVLLNQMAAAFFPGVKVGDPVTLVANGKRVTFRLAGVTKQILNPATAYVNPAAFASLAGIPADNLNGIRLVLTRHDPATISAVTGTLEAALTAQSISMKVVISETMLESATSGHVYIFIFALLLIAGVMAVVGALGLMSSMSTSVIERTREFGIMRTVGARSRTILRNVISEGLLVGLLSWGLAVPLALPLTGGIGYLVGMMSFRAALPLILSPWAVLGWLLLILIGSVAASAYPAWQASRLTIRETLVYI